MCLSLETLATHVVFQSIFCDGRSMMHNSDVKSRETEVQQSRIQVFYYSSGMEDYTVNISLRIITLK